MAKHANKRKKKSWPPRKQQPSVSKKTGPPRHFSHVYGADMLRGVGPLVFAGWLLPQALVQQLKNEGKHVHPGISGVLLLDTGATSSCIDIDVATDLGLKPTRLAKTHGVHGLSETPVYHAHLVIGISDNQGNKSEYNREFEAQGANGLQQLGEAWGLTHDTGKTVRLIGLLGRDVLRSTKFNYDGVNGILRVVFY